MEPDLFEKFPRPWVVTEPRRRSAAVEDGRGREVVSFSPVLRDGGRLARIVCGLVVEAVNAYGPAKSAAPEFRPWRVVDDETGIGFVVIRGDGSVYGRDQSRTGCRAIVEAVNESHGYTADGQPIEPAPADHDDGGEGAPAADGEPDPIAIEERLTKAITDIVLMELSVAPLRAALAALVSNLCLGTKEAADDE